MANAFFQLVNREESTCLQIIPPTDGGIMFSIQEIQDYLTFRGIMYDLATLNKGIRDAEHATAPVMVTLNLSTFPKERESYLISVSADKMLVTVRFFAPSVGGELMQMDEFLNDLAHRNISYGIDTAIVREYFTNRRFCTNMIIAHGKLPRQGRDSYIEYYFNTDVHAKPALNEDGSVDFFNLSIINHCKEGDLLAKLFPEDPGENGENVLGELIRPREVKKNRLQYGGKNVILSEDRCKLTAGVNGHVSLVNDKVFVSNVFEIKNVDNSTGNIEYDGDVLIEGNVCTNFSVKTGGNIEVRGVVEGAYLEAGGNITIASGMNGMGKGTLKAGGNIVVKYLENTTATAGGLITAESILHSRVSSGNEIDVTGNRGFISGGRVSALNTISVKTLGSAMGSDTVIEVGADPSLKQTCQALQKQVAEGLATLKQMEPVLVTMQQKIKNGVRLMPDQLKYLTTLVNTKKQKQLEVNGLLEELKTIETQLSESNNAQVIVKGEVYGGTKICIGDISMVVSDSMKYCKFVKIQGEVKMTAL